MMSIVVNQTSQTFFFYLFLWYNANIYVVYVPYIMLVCIRYIPISIYIYIPKDIMRLHTQFSIDIMNDKNKVLNQK